MSETNDDTLTLAKLLETHLRMLVGGMVYVRESVPRTNPDGSFAYLMVKDVLGMNGGRDILMCHPDSAEALLQASGR